jgi:hypothetical protein
MIVEDYIGEILLRIAGGELTPDISVRRGEVKTYLAMAVNYVLTGQYWAESRAEGEKTINRLLYTPFEINAAPDAYGKWYLTLPKKMVTIAKGRALEIQTLGGRMCYPLQQGDDMLEEFYSCLKPEICSYIIDSSTRIKLFNKPPLVNAFKVKYWVELSDLNDTDELLIPTDAQVTVIDMAVKFLLGERKEDKDYNEDQQDNA